MAVGADRKPGRPRWLQTAAEALPVGALGIALVGPFVAFRLPWTMDALLGVCAVAAPLLVLAGTGWARRGRVSPVWMVITTVAAAHGCVFAWFVMAWFRGHLPVALFLGAVQVVVVVGLLALGGAVRWLAGRAGGGGGSAPRGPGPAATDH